MIIEKFKFHQVLWLLGLIFCLSLLFRSFNLNRLEFKEDEHFTVKAASYLHFCRLDTSNCLNQPDTFTRKLNALISNNETRPNLLNQIYLWDWIKNQPTKIHFARAWPHLELTALVYCFFDISHWSSRLISVISGSLLVIVGFLLAKVYQLSIPISLAYSLTLAISYHLIDISRSSRLYAFYVLSFSLTIYFLSRFLTSKKLASLIIALIFFTLSYFLQLNSLLLLPTIFIFSTYQAILKKSKVFKLLSLVLLSGFLTLLFLKLKLNLDFFHSYFITLKLKPNWSYLEFIFGNKILSFFGWGLILLNLKKIFSSKKLTLIFFIITTYTFFLIFFANLPPSSIYVIHLLPLSYLLVLSLIQNYFFAGILLGLASLHLILNFRSLYFPPFNRPQLSQAYQSILSRFKPNNQILGIQIKDYYLKDLPKNSNLINLPENQSMTLSEFQKLINHSIPTFVVFETEKKTHLKPEILNYLDTYFKKLTGTNLDHSQVEVFYLAK